MDFQANSLTYHDQHYLLLTRDVDLSNSFARSNEDWIIKELTLRPNKFAACSITFFASTVERTLIRSVVS